MISEVLEHCTIAFYYRLDGYEHEMVMAVRGPETLDGETRYHLLGASETPVKYRELIGATLGLWARTWQALTKGKPLVVGDAPSTRFELRDNDVVQPLVTIYNKSFNHLSLTIHSNATGHAALEIAREQLAFIADMNAKTPGIVRLKAAVPAMGNANGQEEPPAKGRGAPRQAPASHGSSTQGSEPPLKEPVVAGEHLAMFEGADALPSVKAWMDGTHPSQTQSTQPAPDVQVLGEPTEESEQAKTSGEGMGPHPIIDILRWQTIDVVPKDKQARKGGAILLPLWKGTPRPAWWAEMALDYDNAYARQYDDGEYIAYPAHRIEGKELSNGSRVIKVYCKNDLGVHTIWRLRKDSEDETFDFGKASTYLLRVGVDAEQDFTIDGDFVYAVKIAHDEYVNKDGITQYPEKKKTYGFWLETAPVAGREDVDNHPGMSRTTLNDDIPF